MHIIDLFDYCRVKIDFFIHSNIKKKNFTSIRQSITIILKVHPCILNIQNYVKNGN